jgi:hypothetical protein
MNPGWIRFSIHPTMTNDEINYITAALNEIATNHKEWANDYNYDADTNEFSHKEGEVSIHDKVNHIFDSI